MNTGKRLVEFLIICKTAVESLQKVETQLPNSSSLRSIISKRTARTAAASSSLGMDMVFNEANLHFPIKKLQLMLP